MTNATSSSFSFIEGLSSDTQARILFVSLAINFCIALQLLISSFFFAIKTWKNHNIALKSTEDDSTKALVRVFSDEITNVLLSILAVVCVCIYPVNNYSNSAVPSLLEILICVDCGRYIYRIGIHVSWDGRNSNKNRFPEFVHHSFALMFYMSILITQENWWMGVIGNFLEMESLITSIHFVLKRTYIGYEIIETSCLCIQVVSTLCVRIVLPSVLCSLFVPQMGNLQTTLGTVSLYTAMVFFSLYNLIYLLGLRVYKLYVKRKLQQKLALDGILPQIIKKQPVHYIEINNILPDCGKSKTLMLSPHDSSILPQKQLTWSMVGQEDISAQPHSVPPNQKNKNRVSNKSVRFAEQPRYSEPEEIRVKPTLNVNTDTVGSAAANSKAYCKNLIFKPDSPEPNVR